MKFVWSDDYSLGIEAIDEQHQHLFALGNSLPDNLDGEVAAQAILELYRYTRTHFRDEEQVMRDVAYSGYEEHRAKHDGLIEKLAGVKASDFADDESTLEFKKFVFDWIINHIMCEDQKFAECLRSDSRVAR